MRVKITQEVIDQCKAQRKGFYNPCPVAHVLRQPPFPRAHVIVNGINIYVGKRYKVPVKVRQFLIDWDNKRAVRPLSFRLVEWDNGLGDKLRRLWRKIGKSILMLSAVSEYLFL